MLHLQEERTIEMKTRTLKSRIASIILTLSLVIGLFGMMPMAAIADSGAEFGSTSDIPDTINAVTNPATKVYFGVDGYDSDTPLLWRVVAKDDDTITMFADSIVHTDNTDSTTRKIRSGGDNVIVWQNYDICHWLNGTRSPYTTSGFLQKAFKTAEQTAIENYGTTEVGNVAKPGVPQSSINQKIVLPSVAEVGWEGNPGTWGFIDDNQRNSNFSGNNWWLRSSMYADGAKPSKDSSIISAYISTSGYYDPAGIDNANTYAIRPAFKINLDSIVFTSAAAGGKSASAGSTLTKAGSPSGNLKLTIKDNTNLSLKASITENEVKAGETVSISYTDANVGTGKYVSALILDEDEDIIFYGKLLDLNSAGASGTTTFTVPNVTDMPAGDYTVRVFNEEINGDNLTDYASTPVDIPLTVLSDPDNTAPVLTEGDVSRASDADATVKFSSDEAGTYYYQLDGDAPEDAEALVSAGTNQSTLAVGEQTITLDSLTAGDHKIYIAGEDAVDNVSNLLEINIPDFGSATELAKHEIIKHSHDKKYGGKDGLTAYSEDIVIKFDGDFENVTEFKFNNNQKQSFTLSPYVDDDTARTITEVGGKEIGTITHGSVIVTLPAEFADKLENGTHELQVWLSDSIPGNKSTAGIATIVVNRTGSVKYYPINPIIPEDDDPINPMIPQGDDPINPMVSQNDDPINPLILQDDDHINPVVSQNDDPILPIVPQTSDDFLLFPLIMIIGVSFTVLLTLIAVAVKRRRSEA
jgi:hypothetical protein